MKNTVGLVGVVDHQVTSDFVGDARRVLGDFDLLFLVGLQGDGDVVLRDSPSDERH